MGRTERVRGRNDIAPGGVIPGAMLKPWYEDLVAKQSYLIDNVTTHPGAVSKGANNRRKTPVR